MCLRGLEITFLTTNAICVLQNTTKVIEVQTFLGPSNDSDNSCQTLQDYQPHKTGKYERISKQVLNLLMSLNYPL